ncbi:MAG TPA: nucleotidyltransferase domain-containing protein [Polyangiaceae bacterium]|nr:nucleotidyltransferase domain-containing protein [Polyangiaceae bacterium]
MRSTAQPPPALDRDRVVSRLAGLLEGHAPPLAAAYLFGSVARGEAKPWSDVDVGLLYSTDPPRTLAALPTELTAELTHALGAEVDLVVLNRAPVDLVHRVLRDGILVVDADRSRRIAFEVASRNAYWDLLPVLQRYRRPRTPPP